MRRPFSLLAAALAFVVAFALFAVPSATAQGPGQDESGFDNRHDQWWRGISDREYLRDATQGYRFEIAISELAQRESDDRDVRDLAEDFEDDYRGLLADTEDVARQLGIDVRRDLDRRLQEIVDRLADLENDEFDRAWLRVQVFAHRALLALNLRGAIRGESEEVRELAQNSLPIITDNFGDLLDVIEDRRNGRDDHRGRHDKDNHGRDHRNDDNHRKHDRGHRARR